MAFNIKINKVEDVQYTYNNENEYNHEDSLKKQAETAAAIDGKTVKIASATSNNNSSTNKAVIGDRTPESKAKSEQIPVQSKKQIETVEEKKQATESIAAAAGSQVNSFKEVEHGFVVLQEEEEEGELFAADEPGKFMKKTK